jgi:glycosyltransferase involved in cell wall biosynthesis
VIGEVVSGSRPDVIISFTDTTNITALLACSRTGIPIIISERVDPSQHKIGWLRDQLRTYTYPKAKFIVVPSRRVGDYFPAMLQPKIRVIGNPVPVCTLQAQPTVANGSGRKRVVAVGRHEPQKGFDLLIEAFALIAPDYPDWDLVIFGDGPYRPKLEARIQGLALGTRVTLKGIVTDVFEELSASHLIAFPSRYEGFPNALAEGMAMGLAAVGYQGVSGVEDLILNGKTGLLTEPQEGAHGLASAIATLMANDAMRGKLGRAAREHVRHWAPDRVFALWEDLLQSATSSR